MDTIFGKVEAVVKIFVPSCCTLSSAISPVNSWQLQRVQLCMAGFFQQFKGCFQQVSGLHIGIACFHGAMDEAKEHASPKTLG